MARHVIVLEEGSHDPPALWPGAGELDPASLGEGQESAWAKLCRQVIVWAQTGAKVSLEIFICLLGDEPVVPPDRSSLASLLRQARNCSWGARLFLVASGRIRAEKLVRRGKESRELWMRTALEGKVLDFLQVDYDPRKPETIKLEDLRGAADDSGPRQRWIAVQSGTDGGWRCVVDSEQRNLQSFLSVWLQVPGPEQAPNLLIVVDDLRPAKQRAMILRTCKRYPGRQYLVATLQPAPGLLDFCLSQGLPAPVELRGPFELWYFLLRLNERSRPRQLGPAREYGLDTSDPASNGHVHEVALDRIPVFHPHANGAPLSIVITNAFDPNELAQCLEAARDVGLFLERCPLGSRVLVEPALTLRRLFQVMERWTDFNVWVHLGHGYGAKGLKQAGQDRPVTPREILRCFRGRGQRVALAMFLACRSSPMAALFARAGAGVAIGFEDKVDSDMGRELAVEVLEVMLAEGMGQDAVLRGFRLGCNRIELQEQHPSWPVAFYPRPA
ncbi:MAG TPA: hypothetical protein VJ725_03205 [Thermoanaerobaculia bacterium]|nr:hypothetical protein [Thermoanaerobaculia bacterium]